MSAQIAEEFKRHLDRLREFLSGTDLDAGKLSDFYYPISKSPSPDEIKVGFAKPGIEDQFQKILSDPDNKSVQGVAAVVLQGELIGALGRYYAAITVDNSHHHVSGAVRDRALGKDDGKISSTFLWAIEELLKGDVK